MDSQDDPMNKKETDLSQLSYKEIRRWVERKAYEFYLARGRRQDNSWQDWFDAEKLLVQELLKN